MAQHNEMPGTRANPMPGATRGEIDRARAEWAANDPMTQGQRAELARAAGEVVIRGADGYVVDE